MSASHKMKFYQIVAVVLVFVGAIIKADDAKLSQNNTPLSLVNDGKQQTKRLAAYFGSTNNLSSGFKPITTNISPANNFQQQYSSSLAVGSNGYNKYSQTQNQQQQYVSAANAKYASLYPRTPPFTFSPQLTYAASQPAAAVSLIHTPYQLAQQQIPFHHYNVHQVAPVFHTPIGIVGSFQTPANNYYVNPQIQKIPTIYNNHQPQTINAAASYQALNSYKQQPQTGTIISSKPVAVDAHSQLPLSLSSNEVHHNQHGAVSYASFAGKGFPSAAALIAPLPQNVYYQPQMPSFYASSPANDYTKQFHAYSQLPIAANYFPNHAAYSASVPTYAHINKIPIVPTPASTQVVSVSVVPSIPQKINLH